ncbi:hypothetical protein ACFTAO_01670 [Paenibacillus rhizoplanae]
MLSQNRRGCRLRERTASRRAQKTPAPVLFAVAKSEELSSERSHGFAPVRLEALGFAHSAEILLLLCKARNSACGKGLTWWF